MIRIRQDEWGLQLAEVTAKRGTCLRRQVGCVLLDFQGKVLATGYNGVPKGVPHCNELVPSTHLFADARTREPLMMNPHACKGVGFPSGANLDGCEATHAEINALVQCKNDQAVWTAYCTASPCIQCVKALMNTSCVRVVFREVYPHPRAQSLWVDRDPVHFQWIHLPKET